MKIVVMLYGYNMYMYMRVYT